MLFSLPLFISILAFFSNAANAANAWAGSNLYYAAGLSTDEQTSLFTALQSAGVKVLRVWLDGQPYAQKGTTITTYSDLEDPVGTFDDSVLNLLDDVMVNAAKYDIKLLIDIYSANSLNANDAYGEAYGQSGFYTNSDAISKFEDRLWHVLYHVNPNNGKQWKDCSEYIFAFEAMNEAFAGIDSTGDFANEHASWQCTVAGSLRSALNGSTDIALLTGGGQWLSESMQDAYLNCDALDILGIHAYGSGDLQTSPLSSAVSQATANGKLLLLEEWGACYYDTDQNNCPSGDMLATSTRNSNIETWGKNILEAGIPLMYWQIIPNADPHQSVDYEVGITNDASWSTLKSLLSSASSYSSPFDFSPWLPS